MRVHPAADIFPMVPDDALASLAESIKANGLRFPIVVRKISDGNGGFEDELIDGRNRERACEIVKVEPTYTVFEGDDDAVRAYIADVNLERRDLKKGQKAMVLARLYPEVKRGRGNIDPARKTLDSSDFSQVRLREARQVLAHSLSLAEDVLHDRIGLDAALVQVRKEQGERDAKIREEQGRRAEIDAKMARLHQRAADLAERVTEECMGLDEAIIALEERERHNKALIEHGRHAVNDLKQFGSHISCVATAFKLGEKVLTQEEFEEIRADFLRLQELMENS